MKDVVQTNVVEKTVIKTNVVNTVDLKKTAVANVTEKRETVRRSQTGIRIAQSNGYNWKYKIVEDGVEITACEKDDKTLFSAIEPTPAEDLAIPSSLDGRPVVSIGRWAFLRCRDLRHVKIPEGVAALHNRGVFFGCSSLESVSFPSSLKELSVCETFSGCSSLKEIEFAGEPPVLTDKIGHRANKEMGRLLFRGVPADCIVRVRQAVGGWGHEWPEEFASRRRVVHGSEIAADLDSGKQFGRLGAQKDVNPDNLKDRDPTRAVQKTLDALFPGWKTSEVGESGRPGYWAERDGERNVLCTHPPRIGVPVTLSKSVSVFGKHPMLHVKIANNESGRQFRLRVRVNGKVLREKDIKDGWTDVYVALGASSARRRTCCSVTSTGCSEE